ncbi:MAG: 6,7-dimethyl-8-ribityllumazine synthase [Balneolaceae bacterium]
MNQLQKAEVDWKKIKVAIVVARWNSLITDEMMKAAYDTLINKGIPESHIVVARCPGSYELPLASKKCFEHLDVDAVVAIGAIIRGGTPHFEYVCDAVNRGITDLNLTIGKPVAFGVLTTDTVKQAKERASIDKGNKGAEAAHAVCEMIELEEALRERSKDF